MMWTKLTIDTTVEAVDLISAFLDEKGVEGVMIEDHVPLTEEDKAAMFVDIPLVDGEDDATAMAGKFVASSLDENTQASLIDETLKEMGDDTWRNK